MSARNDLGSAPVQILRKPIASKGYHVVSTTAVDASDEADTRLQQSTKSTHEPFSTHVYGQPAQKSQIDSLDLFAVIIAMLSLAVSAILIDTRLPYAAHLGYSGQIIAIGFLLGVMNQCLQRVLPYSFILVESRYGASTLQNYDGLLKWSPFTNKLSAVWRLVLMLLIALPLTLSALYKRFNDGLALQSAKTESILYLPTAPPGMQVNIGLTAIVANATVPFLASTTDDVEFPSDLSTKPRVFGYNTILLSNSSAAALDAPNPDHVSFLQQGLESDSSIILTANVRGTVAQYNSSVEDYRSDQQYWNNYYSLVSNWTVQYLDNWCFGLLQIDVASSDDPSRWNDTWSFYSLASSSNVSAMNFAANALLFESTRHACKAKWKLTRSSMELLAGDCNPLPLEASLQFYGNADLGIMDQFSQFYAQALGSFATTRKESPWLLATHAVVVASVYQTVIAGHNGYVPVQPGGPIWEAAYEAGKLKNIDGNFDYYETYMTNEVRQLEVRTLNNRPGLYCILAMQPVLTLLAFCVVAAMQATPLARSFGLVSILAGVNRASLDLLKCATFSGRLKAPIGLGIKVREAIGEGQDSLTTIEYCVGKFGLEGSMRRGEQYG
jgi:hypothetical protein